MRIIFATQKFSVKVADTHSLVLEDCENCVQGQYYCDFLLLEHRNDVETDSFLVGHICNGFCPRPQQCLCNHLSSDFFQIWNFLKVNWVSQEKKKNIFFLFLFKYSFDRYENKIYNKGKGPPLLRSAVLWFFLRGTFDYGLWFYISWNKFWQKNMFFDPLYDPLVEWRWALQVVTNATMEPKGQWWEVH